LSDLVAVILAAGTGYRLKPFTDSTPKCLVDVGGRTILDRLLCGLADAGVRRAIVVAGYLSERIITHLAVAALPIDAVTVTNAAYATTNNAVSLAAARSALAGRDFILCDGDVVFTVNPFPSLLRSPDDCVVAMDALAPFNAEAMKVELGADGHIKTLSKALTEQQSAGESLGIQRIGGDALPRLWDAIDVAVARDAVRSYYEDAFQQLLDQGLRMGVSRVGAGTCLEIDDAADLEAARRLLASTS
jgi:choline kinase